MIPDILNDDYSLKRTLKMKHVTPAGLVVTSKSEHQKGVNGALEAKFFHAKPGVMFDKAKVTSKDSRFLTYKKRPYANPFYHCKNFPTLFSSSL